MVYVQYLTYYSLLYLQMIQILFFCAGETSQQLLEIATEESIKLKIWFDRNKLLVNVNKTTLMLFGNCKTKKDDGAKLSINNVEVEQVWHTKTFGCDNR